MNLYLVSYDNGSRIPGARLAPYKLYEAINRSRLSSKVTDFKIHSINMYNDNALEAEKKISCIVEKNSFKKNELNLFVGGDHSITCFFAKSLSLKGLIPNDSFLVIFDAHFDGFCKTEFSRIKNYNFVETLSVYFQHIFIIGFRDYYPPVKNVPLKVTLI
ncbi:arginase family protein, partial [Enterococcus faecalis]|nr:arginase family protein [Enterococcus faecalis]